MRTFALTGLLPSRAGVAPCVATGTKDAPAYPPASAAPVPQLADAGFP